MPGITSTRLTRDELLQKKRSKMLSVSSVIQVGSVSIWLRNLSLLIVSICWYSPDLMHIGLDTVCFPFDVAKVEVIPIPGVCANSYF